MKTPLTDIFVKNLAKPGRFTDLSVTGLNLQVKPNGGKYWIFRYVKAWIADGHTLESARVPASLT